MWPDSHGDGEPSHRSGSMRKVGIDIGGTFTDLTLADEQRTATYKLPSTPASPAKAALEGLATRRVGPPVGSSNRGSAALPRHQRPPLTRGLAGVWHNILPVRCNSP
jgi:hypothetical protein